MLRAAVASPRRRSRSALCLLVVSALTAAACGSDDDGSSASTSAPTETTAAIVDDTAPATTEAAVAESTPETTGTTEASGGEVDFPSAFPDLGPPTGEPISIALINTEGVPGLDFPDIREDISGAVEYLNEHGGFGGRPIELVNCVTAGSPETSQACAQEVAGKNVELVLLGLDLFPDYNTYAAAGLPVIGVLPILPGDYTADALFLTGGNATVGAAMAAVAKEHFDAKTVGIVSSDNPGANASEAALTASLDLAGIAHTTVKGGDNETDAGYQGLMRQAAADDPDLLVSLYSDAGCIGTMRGRAAMGITIPVLTTGICSSKEVIDQVGDDAVGWIFTGVATPEETPTTAILREIMGNVLDIAPEEVDPTSLGLGGLGLFLIMSLAEYANRMEAEGIEVTADNLYGYLQETPGLTLWPGDQEIACGLSETYPSICSFTFPFAEYKAGGLVETVPGLEAVSSVDYLP
jgi:branched-chain amino acid transport system substrate-binding protein